MLQRPFRLIAQVALVLSAIVGTAIADDSRGLPAFLILAVITRYDPYGKATVLDAGGVIVGVTSAVGNPWTFTERRFDGETGLMYYRARMYSTELGRFIGRDPIKYRGSEWNLYEYVESQPATALDPFGLTKLLVKSSAPVPGPCGHVRWVVNWYIDPKAEETGTIIQEVRVTGLIEYCSKSRMPTVIHEHYAEAWTVYKGAFFPVDPSDDTFWNSNRGICSKGWMRWEAKVGWHPGNKAPWKWKTDKNHPSGGLPFFDIGRRLVEIPLAAPLPYDSSLNTTPHNLEIRWNCCEGPSHKSNTEIVSHTP